MINKIFTSIKTAWSIIGITLILVVTLECASYLLLHLKKITHNTDRTRIESDIYAGAPWIRDYVKEHLKSERLEWNPYTYWRRKPFKGKYINIDSQGIRYTWNKTDTLKTSVKVKNIFVFGGSTSWGSESRDEYTIPSVLSKFLSQDSELKINITNFGETGYVNTQEMIMLLCELQKGNVPDMVIFYDGVNDIASALENKIAGISMNEPNRRKEFNILKDYRRKDLYKEAVYSIIKNSWTCGLINNIFPKINIDAYRKSHYLSYSESEKLAEDILRVYSSNVKLIEAVSRLYGFKTIFYWQPVIFTKKNLTPYENRIAKKAEILRAFYLKVYDKVKNSSLLFSFNEFHDLSNIFDNYNKSYFIDYCHLTEAGNEIVAKKISTDILQILKYSPQK